MKDLEELKKIKEKFEKGEIAEEDIDPETQKEIMKLYEKEINEINEDILVLEKENQMYENKIKELKNKFKELFKKNK